MVFSTLPNAYELRAPMFGGPGDPCVSLDSWKRSTVSIAGDARNPEVASPMGGNNMGLSVTSPITETQIGAGVFSNDADGQQASPCTDTDALFSALYTQLHSLARRELARRIAPATLSVTTLLHEAYIDMSARSGASFPDQARFIGYAARVMRGLIIDHARSRTAMKRGGEFEITSLITDLGESFTGSKELSDIGDALDQLAKVEPDLAEIVELKFFCGCSFAEIASLRDLSERTVQRKWEKARIFLRNNLSPQPPDAVK